MNCMARCWTSPRLPPWRTASSPGTASSSGITPSRRRFSTSTASSARWRRSCGPGCSRARSRSTSCSTSDLPHVRGDRVELQQVLLNLILNSIEAMETVDPRSRRITIDTRLTAERHEVAQGNTCMRCRRRSGTRARGLKKPTSIDSSRPSTRPSPAEQVSASPSADSSSKHTRGGSGPNRARVAGRPSASRCRWPPAGRCGR